MESPERPALIYALTDPDVPQAMREALQRRAAARGQNPSPLVQEALRRFLTPEE